MSLAERLEIVWNRLRSANTLTYAPEGWRTRVPRAPAGCGFASGENFDSERRAVAALAARVETGREPPGGFSPTDVRLREVYGQALAAAARGKQRVSILDYGGGLGHAYWEARLLLPHLALDFHCKELPAMAAAGRRLTPAAIWHDNDACLDRSYDLVMFGSSLQYIEDWRSVLACAAGAARPWLFLTRTVTVQRVASYVAVQRLEGAYFLHQQLNAAEIFAAVRAQGFSLERELPLDFDPHMRVKGAPEQPICRAWLFRRDGAA